MFKKIIDDLFKPETIEYQERIANRMYYIKDCNTENFTHAYYQFLIEKPHLDVFSVTTSSGVKDILEGYVFLVQENKKERNNENVKIGTNDKNTNFVSLIPDYLYHIKSENSDIFTILYDNFLLKNAELEIKTVVNKGIGNNSGYYIFTKPKVVL